MKWLLYGQLGGGTGTTGSHVEVFGLYVNPVEQVHALPFQYSFDLQVGILKQTPFIFSQPSLQKQFLVAGSKY